MLDIKEKRHITVVGRGGASNIDWEDIENKPDFATVATSGSYNDLTDKPEIPGQVNADWDATSGVSQILNKPNLATVATSGSYDDLSNKPTIPSAQVNSDWDATSGVAQILNKPELATVATSGSYNDLTNKPDLTHYVEDTDLATVATSGSYNDLSDKPTIPAAQVNADWNANSGVAQILNKPNLATVATSGSYDDLSNKPTIPSAQVNADWNASSGVQQILNKPTLATVATTGSYNDLTDKPTVTQEQADWNQTDTTAVDYIKNKPEIPSVPAMATQELTFTLQGGTTKTIEFYTVPNYFYVEDISGSDNTLTITKSDASAPTIEVFKSTDKTNWESIGTTSTTAITATIPANGKLYLKATVNNWASAPTYYNGIKCTGNYNVGGNIMSLLYSDNFENQTTLSSDYIFASLFNGNNKLVNAQKLVLPATALRQYCYSNMFASCTSLTTAPALPATTLTHYCYQSMFYRCTSLTTAPALPATTLAQNCYQQMFNYCTSLTTAPVLPATTLINNCYASMFDSCRRLNKVTTYATNISATNCLNNWLNGVASTGDFYNLGGATYPSGSNGIPTGWTEHTSL